MLSVCFVKVFDHCSKFSIFYQKFCLRISMQDGKLPFLLGWLFENSVINSLKVTDSYFCHFF